MADNITWKRSGRRIGKGVRIAGGCALSTLIGLALFVGVYHWNNRPLNLVFPAPKMPTPNAYDTFADAGRQAKAMAHISPFSMPGTTAQTYTLVNFKACAKDAVPIQQTVRVGLKQAYLCPPERSANSMQFKNYALFRETARTLAGKARYEELSKHPAQAMGTLLDMEEESVMLPRGGGLIAGLVGIACESISTRPMEALLPKLTDGELAHVAARLETIAGKREPYANLIAEEGNISAALLLEALHKPGNRGMIFGIQEVTGHIGIEITWQDRLLMLQLAFANKQALVRHQQAFYKALAEESKLPYAGPSKVQMGNDPFSKILTSEFGEVRARFVTKEAIQAMLRVEVGLERCKRAQGRFPAELTQLTPTYLQTIPLDPCINAPLHYQMTRNGQDYVLYSVGEDRKDDHAQPQKSPGDGSQGDLVARHLWKPLPLLTTPGKQKNFNPR